MHKIICKIWENNKWPTDWVTSEYVPLPKSGDILECGNNRTIALISHASKILLRIIKQRMQATNYREISDLQAGFRQGRGTRDLIVDLTCITQKAREWQIPLFLCFIDYKKAFDTVNHNILWKSLKQLGWPTHYIYILSHLYDFQKCRVRLDVGTSDNFMPGKGVRQGCPQSPDLFSIYTEIIMRTALENYTSGFKIGGRTINHLRYADDTVLIATTADNLQTLINQVNEAGKSFQLRLNVKKNENHEIRYSSTKRESSFPSRQ